MRSPCIVILHMKFFNDAFEDEDRDGNAEDSNEGKVAAGPPEVVLEVFPRRSPILDPAILVCLHSAPHVSLTSDYFLSLARGEIVVSLCLWE